MKFLLPLFLAGVTVANAQSICSRYTTALFKTDTGSNELMLLTAVVDLAVLGNATLNVPGILNPAGGILKTFNATGNTTNRGGKAVILNFLDGAAGLPGSPPPPSSNTAVLLNHLYQFFGALLGCTASGFPAYGGTTDMMDLHRFMNISKSGFDYFVTQVGLSAKALGVVDADVTAIGNLLTTSFGFRCSPKVTAGLPAFEIGSEPSICQGPSCPLAANATASCAAGAAAPTATTPTATPPTASPPAKVGFFKGLIQKIKGFFGKLFGKK